MPMPASASSTGRTVAARLPRKARATSCGASCMAPVYGPIRAGQSVKHRRGHHGRCASVVPAVGDLRLCAVIFGGVRAAVGMQVTAAVRTGRRNIQSYPAEPDRRGRPGSRAGAVVVIRSGWMQIFVEIAFLPICQSCLEWKIFAIQRTYCRLKGRRAPSLLGCCTMDFWPEDFVKKFIMSQLNFFLTDHPDSDAGRLELTNWKWWIWLEQHGYDFCRNSLRLMLIQYHGGDIPAFSYRQERVLMFQIRNKMREILGFPEFPPAMIESFVKSKTVDYGKHWSAASYRDGSIILDGQYISDIATNFSNFLSSRNPEIVKMINTLIEDASNGVLLLLRR